MLLRYVLCLGLVLLPLIANAQQFKKSSLKVHLFPLTVLEIDGGLRGGFEYRSSKYFSIKADYNHLLDALNKSPDVKNLSGYSLRLEPRFFMDEDYPDLYGAVQLQYKTKAWQLNSADSIKPLQHIFSMNIVAGNQKYLTKRLGLDYYLGAGFGPRYNTVAYGEGFFRRKEGRSLRLSLQLGASVFMKIGN